jgi:hypothetical protein
MKHILDRKRIKGLNPPQRELGMIDKSPRSQNKNCVSLVLLIIYFVLIFPRN